MSDFLEKQLKVLYTVALNAKRILESGNFIHQDKSIEDLKESLQAFDELLEN